MGTCLINKHVFQRTVTQMQYASLK